MIEQILILIATAGTSGAAGWFFTRRQYNAAASVTEADAVKQMQEAYSRFVQDSNARINELKLEVELLNRRILSIGKELEECKRQYTNEKGLDR